MMVLVLSVVVDRIVVVTGVRLGDGGCSGWRVLVW